MFEESQKQLSESILNPDYLAVSGSRLYGTNREDSDHDLRGFVIPPFPYLIGVMGFNDADLEGDHKVYSLKRFLDLTLNGDPQLTELLFVPEHLVRNKNEVSEVVLGLKDKIVSHKIFRRVVGFSYSEWRKANGTKWEMPERTKSEEDVVMDIRNVFSPDKDRMDHLIDILFENHEIKVVPSLASLGGKRKAEFDKFGFGVSSAAHSIRLLKEVNEIMLTGTMTFPRPEANVLRDIRLGKYTLEQVTPMYEEALAEVKESELKSELRKNPDTEFVQQTYVDLIRSRLKEGCLVG